MLEGEMPSDLEVGLELELELGAESEGDKVEILFILVALAVLGALAILRGVDSTPSVDDPEWEHRREWAAAGRLL